MMKVNGLPLAAPEPCQDDSANPRIMTDTRKNQRELCALAQPVDAGHLPVPYETPVTPSRIIRQIAETMVFSQTGDISRIGLQLSPEFLGRVSIILALAADGMSADIQTQNGAVRDMLTANLFKLEDELRGLGLNISFIEITCAGPTGDPADGHQDGRIPRSHQDSYGSGGTRPVTMARFHQAARIPMPPVRDGGFSNP